jgi:carbamoyltransferase
MKNKKILGINISHNASICQLTNGKIDFYLEEDRFNKKKNWCPNPTQQTNYISIEKYAKKEYKNIIFASFGRQFPKQSEEEFSDYVVIDDLKKQLGTNKNFTFHPNQHHIYHAYCGFYFSGMKEALCIIMDGGGVQPYEKPFQEIESIYYLTEETCLCYYKHLTNSRWVPEFSESVVEYTKKDGNIDLKFSSQFSSGQKFGLLTNELGLGSGNESGKTMGLASYGNLKGNQPKDKARQLQVSTKEDTIELIKKAISYNNCKNIILSGGYALNCVNNYEYLKEFPNHNFFVDPVAHDGGTAIGAALWYYKNGN